MLRRTALALAAAALALPAFAQESIKVGLVLPMTGPFASTGRQIEAAVRLYLAQNGSSVAGRKVEVILKDDASVADTTRRLAQELVVNDKVAVLAGFGLTPLALATAPIATQSKTPMVVMAAATSSITEASPYIVRTSFTLPQVTLGIAEWAPKHQVKKAVTLVSDYGPGIDAEKTFKERFALNGGQVLDSLRVPLRNPDFAPFLQKVRDLKPDALFVFVPSGAGSAVGTRGCCRPPAPRPPNLPGSGGRRWERSGPRATRPPPAGRRRSSGSPRSSAATSGRAPPRCVARRRSPRT